MKKYIFIITMLLSNFAFAQMNNFVQTANLPSVQPNFLNQNLLNQNEFGHSGLQLGLELGYDYGEMQGLNSIINTYNERHADKLLTEMPTLERGQKFAFSGQLFLNKVFVSAGFLMNAYQTNSVLNDRANKLYRHRYHLNVQGRHFASQVGYAIYPNRFMVLIVGGSFSSGNYRFMTKTFEPTAYENFKSSELRKQPKHHVKYIGGFGRLMLGNPEFSRLCFFIEGQYRTNVNTVNLQLFNEALNPASFQNDDNDKLNLNHNPIGANIGLVIRLSTLANWWF